MLITSTSMPVETHQLYSPLLWPRVTANLYSLVSSAKANGVEPYAYLRYVFEQLPRATTVEQVEALLPWNVEAVLKERQSKRRNSDTLTR